MKRNISLHATKTLWSLCLVILLTGCGAEEASIPQGTGEKIPLKILLKQPEGLTVQENGSRSAEVEGITLSNVWVVQFNASNEVCLANKYYTAITEIDDYKAQVTTGKDFSNIESNYYIIVNAGASFSTVDNTALTESDLRAKTVKTSAPDPIDLSTAPLQLVAGPVKFTPEKDSGTGSVQAALVAPLERPYACLEFKYTSPAKGDFNPTSLKIKNLPKSLYVCKGEGKYPDTSDISTMEKTIWEWDKQENSKWQATAAKSCYMGENLRGSGTATTAREKGTAAKGPGNALTGCTCITLTGIYKYDALHTQGITAAYTIYLGGNLINDYNLQRNTKYAITINIGGANSADIRVTVTNGNVAYFEEVKEVSPDYAVIL